MVVVLLWHWMVGITGELNFLVYVYLLLHNWGFWGMTGFLTSYGSCSFVALDGGNHYFQRSLVSMNS